MKGLAGEKSPFAHHFEKSPECLVVSQSFRTDSTTSVNCMIVAHIPSTTQGITSGSAATFEIVSNSDGNDFVMIPSFIMTGWSTTLVCLNDLVDDILQGLRTRFSSFAVSVDNYPLSQRVHHESL